MKKINNPHILIPENSHNSLSSLSESSLMNLKNSEGIYSLSLENEVFREAILENANIVCHGKYINIY